MKEPLSRIGIYEALLPLAGKMETFKQKGEVSLTAAEVEQMADVYDSVRVISGQGMGLIFQKTCAVCIREVMHVYVSLFDRLASDPDVTVDVNSAIDTSKIDNVLDLELTEEEDNEIAMYISVLGENATPIELYEKVKEFADTLANPILKKKIESKYPAAQEWIAKESQLQAANTLYIERTNKLQEVGYLYEIGADLKIDGYTFKEHFVDVETLREMSDEQFDELLGYAKEPEPDTHISAVDTTKPAVESEPLIGGVALNTEVSKTPAQKAAEKKASKKSKEAK